MYLLHLLDVSSIFFFFLARGVTPYDQKVVMSVYVGSDAGRGDPGDATGLHLTVSRP